jgi:myo-inositol-1(or 4)-monophosphatase
MEPEKSVLELATNLARAAGAIQRERYATALEIRTKSAPVDLVTEVDESCEELIVSSLEAKRPRDAILAEEGGETDRAAAAWRWVIDPLDGTTNYAHGYPRFCVSIGVELRGARTVGVVYDPLMDELYHAVAGRGAFLNGRPIQVSKEAALDRSLLATGFAYDRRKSEQDNLLATGFAYDRRKSEQDNLDEFAAFLKAARALRRDGSAALDLCYVAAGRLDGFWELKLAPWDVAAGYLIVEEAGGICSDVSGGPAPASGSEVVASNGRIHQAMLEVLRSVR